MFAVARMGLEQTGLRFRPILQRFQPAWVPDFFLHDLVSRESEDEITVQRRGPLHACEHGQETGGSTVSPATAKRDFWSACPRNGKYPFFMHTSVTSDTWPGVRRLDNR
jgi:hypothetical protein